MDTGCKRTMIARSGAVLSFACGLIGLLAGLTGHTWKLGAEGWFEGGLLLALIAVFILADGMFSFRRDLVGPSQRG